VTVSDSTTTLPQTTLAITVTPVDDAPVAGDDSYTVVAKGTLTVPAPGVLANDTDADTAPAALSATLVGNVAHGTLSLNPNGGFTYTPAQGYAGPDSFTYRTGDGVGQSSVATVAITVTPTQCVPRPGVVPSPVAGGGKLSVHVEATPLNTQQNNPLQRIVFGTLQNAKVTLNGQTIASGQTYTAPANSIGADFTVERVTAGQPTTVPFTVVDGCGEWKTFVGGGTAAGF
jgi:large repetitive protein